MGLMDGDMLVHASVSRRGRFPALRELYSGALNRFAPNPNLRPENLVAIEGGFTTRVGAGEFQAVAFRHQLNDAVVRITLPDRRFLRVNRNQLRSTGVELIGSVPLGRVVLGGDATLQSVALTDPEAGVTNEPENLPEVAGGLRAAFSLPLDVRGSAEARYTGRQFCIDPGTGLDTELDGGTVLNGELARTWWVDRSGAWFRRIETRVAVDNAGAHALYDQCGLPQAGRLFRFQVRVY
jgi:iron complex outermembrane receptor protein